MSDTDAASKVTYRDVFRDQEYRALWLAQLVSMAGDQFARVALSVLVYERTSSALLAAVTLAVSAGAMFVGGLFLGGVADRYPRRTVMVVSDVACLVLVALMIVPGMPVSSEIILLFLATMSVQPYSAARSATNRKTLGDKFELGNVITITTYQAAQLGGFALGGVIAGLAGARIALAIDAVSFGMSALLVWFGVKRRPAADSGTRPSMLAGVYLIFGNHRALLSLMIICMAMFFAAPEGIAVPLSKQFGGGAQSAGWILVALTAGAAVGPIIYVRVVSAPRRQRVTALMASEACAVLILFAFPVTIAWAIVILIVSGLFTGYISDAAAVMIGSVSDQDRGKVSGVIGAGLALGQGVGMVGIGAVAGVISPTLSVAVFGAAGTASSAVLSVLWDRLFR